MADIDTARPALTLAAQVAEHLGEPWTARDDDTARYRWRSATLCGPDDQRVRLELGTRDTDTPTAERGRIVLQGLYPPEVRGRVSRTPGGRDRITVSDEKPAAMIARDIKRRLLPDYVAALITARRLTADDDAREAERAAALDDAAVALAGFGRVTRLPDRGQVWVGSYSDPVQVELTVDRRYSPGSGIPTVATAKVRVERDLLPALIRAIAALAPRRCARCRGPITDPENAPDDDSALCRGCGDTDTDELCECSAEVVPGACPGFNDRDEIQSCGMCDVFDTDEKAAQAVAAVVGGEAVERHDPERDTGAYWWVVVRDGAEMTAAQIRAASAVQG